MSPPAQKKKPNQQPFWVIGVFCESPYDFVTCVLWNLYWRRKCRSLSLIKRFRYGGMWRETLWRTIIPMQGRKLLGKQLRLVIFCYNGMYNKYFGKCLEMLLNFCRVTSQWLVHKLIHNLRESQLTCYYSAKVFSVGLGVWSPCSELRAACPLSSALAYTTVCPGETSVAFHSAALHRFHPCSILSPFRAMLCHFCFREWGPVLLFLFSVLIYPLFSFPLMCFG